MGRSLFEYHPIFGYRFIPGIKARVDHEGGGYLIRANQAGFRCDHEATEHKPADTFRVLLFGDSYTAGDGVSNADRYGDLIEKRLPNVEILNFALPGSGTDQQYLIYNELAGSLDHDLLVIAVLVENIRRVTARYRQYHSVTEGEDKLMAKPYFTIEDNGSLQLHNVPVPKEPVQFDALPAEEREHVDRGGGMYGLRRVVDALGPGVKQFAQTVTRYQPLPAYQDANSPGWRLMRAILLKWVAQSKVPVIVVTIPLYQYVEETSDPTPYQKRFTELAKESDITLHDTLPDFHKVPDSERRGLRFKTDVHPTRAAHQLMAQSIAPVIARQISMAAR
jgi:lysophospholipase L1-like esterase